MPYPLNVPSGRPENVPQEYIPHLLSAIEGFLQMPDLWLPEDYAQGRQQMEQLKVYIVECFGKCGDAVVYPGVAYLDALAGEVYIGGATNRAANANQINGFIVGVTPVAQNNALSWWFYARQGSYTLNILTITGSNYGRLNPIVDGVLDSNFIELYSAAAAYNQIKQITVYVETDGDHYIALKCASKHASSSGYNFYISDLWMTRIGDLP